MTDHACLEHRPHTKLTHAIQSGTNVVLLQDRQLDVQRQTIKTLERRLASMTQAAVDNQTIVRQLQALAQSLLAIENPASIPAQITALVQQHFDVPMVCLDWWGYALAEQSSVQQRPAQAESVETMYCGFADHAPSLAVFANQDSVPGSVVLIPVRLDGDKSPVLGVLGLGSLDKDRFSPTLETDFLQHLAELVCASLRRYCIHLNA